MTTLVCRRIAAAVLAAAATMAAAGSAGAAGPNIYGVQNLISDGSAIAAAATDPALVNAWGLSAGPTTPWWSSNKATNTSTLYTGAGSRQALVVAVPGGPTGTVFNGNTAAFVVGLNGKTGASRFLFDTTSGTILGWSPAVTTTTAIVAVDRSAQGAEYTGLAILADKLYAADFHNARVDVFDAAWNPVSPAGFADPKIPKGWAPFGIQALNGNVLVAYAKQDKAGRSSVAGGGLGYVDEFAPDGTLVARIASRGKKNAPLNAPWGLSLAPAGFGVFAGDLLVGNFGNGRISAYAQLPSGRWGYKGQLREADGTPIAIDGLWAIAFGNGAAAGPTTNLYFTAGPTGGEHGVFGAITVG